MSKSIFFKSNISNHQGTTFQQPATYNVTNFNLIHEFNWPRKHHTITSECRTQRKEIRNFWDESKNMLLPPLGQWRLDYKKYTTSWKWFLSRDLHTLYYREHETWCKYTQPPNRARRRIEHQIDTK